MICDGHERSTQSRQRDISEACEGLTSFLNASEKGRMGAIENRITFAQ
jgi:hypothetical protein